MSRVLRVLCSISRLVTGIQIIAGYLCVCGRAEKNAGVIAGVLTSFEVVGGAERLRSSRVFSELRAVGLSCCYQWAFDTIEV